MATQRFSQDLGPIDAETLCPLLNAGRLGVVHPKAQHCHTEQGSVYDNEIKRV
jgi:hypothetical protein